MKKLLVFSIIIVSSIAAAKAQTHKTTTHTPTRNAHAARQTPVRLLTANDTLSYALGLYLGKSYQQQGVDSLNVVVLGRAIKTVMDKDSALFTDQQMSNILREEGNKYAKIQQEKAIQATAKAKQEGAAFLEKNKTEPDVVTLPDSVQYKILEKGTGAIPVDTDNVKVNYIGTLLDGTEFDNSYKRGQPLDIGVSSVIKGWTEVLKLMPVGSKWRVWIPSDKGYGDRGAGQMIPPGATLQFDIELLDINNK